MPLAAGTPLGPYEIVETLGAGGMGEVYRARDLRLGREVAIKVLPEQASRDPVALQRFEQEARLASSLRHPGIVSVFEVGQAGDRVFIVMELIEGRSLRAMLRSGSLPVRRALEIGAQVADALAKAHDAGVIHRDLKPENVMVTDDGYVKVLDFGLAKIRGRQDGTHGSLSEVETAAALTEKGVVLGTVGYMSPEQARGSDLDHRTDQFSLGAVLYEALTGRRAFRRASAPETLAATLLEEPHPIGSLNPKVPAPLAWIVERCLAKEREDRYRSTVDLARDLRTVRDRLSEVPSGALAGLERPGQARWLEGLPWALLLVSLAGLVALALRIPDERTTAPTFRALTFRRGTVNDARFAPDGGTILVSATWEGAVAGEVFEGHRDRPGWRSLGVTGVDGLAVSARGEMALVRRMLLVRLSMGGGAERPMSEGVQVADWAPDGEALAGISARRSNPAPGVFYTETGKQLEYPLAKVLARAGQGRAFVGLRVSRDGGHVAVVESGGSDTIAVYDRVGTRRELSAGWGSVTGLVWAPSRREVWVTGSPPGQPHGLYSISPAGAVRPLARIPGQLAILDVSLEGRALVTRIEEQTEVRALPPGGAGEIGLSWSDSVRPVGLSVDGRQLLFTDLGLGGGSLGSYLGPTDGDPPMRLADSPALALSGDAQRALLYTPPNLLHLVPTGPGSTRTISLPGLELDLASGIRGVACWPAGGRLLVSAREGTEPARVWVVPEEGGRPRALHPRASLGDCVVSPEGRWGLDTGGLAYALDGGEPRKLPLGENDVALAWSGDGAHVFVVPEGAWGRWPIEIARVRIASGERTPWKTIPRPDAGAGRWGRLLLTPDGRSYIYSFWRQQSRLYLLEGVQ